MDQVLLRMVDANINRAKEGLRVCEDVCRFVRDDTDLTKRLKGVRHALKDIVQHIGYDTVLESRDIEGDVGRSSSDEEMNRKDLYDVSFANFQRVKESLRVLEEVLKIDYCEQSAKIKLLRYDVYAIEKKFSVV